ncbi:MAG: hypothetical protein ACO390_17985, partial [bacterium]
EKIKFINKINVLKTIARFAKGGTTQVVGEGFDWFHKDQKISQLEQVPHQDLRNTRIVDLPFGPDLMLR